jgi:hypothetical protein
LFDFYFKTAKQVEKLHPEFLPDDYTPPKESMVVESGRKVIERIRSDLNSLSALLSMYYQR